MFIMMSGYHFTTDTPPDSTFTDIQNLNNFNEELFNDIVTTAINFIVETQTLTWLNSKLEECCQRHGIGLAGLKAVARSLLLILKSSLRLNLESSLLKKDLTSLGLGEDKANSLSEKWRVNQKSMLTSVFDQTLSVNRLVDMDWKFGVTAASSAVDKVGNTFLQLKLTIDKGQRTEDVTMELTLAQFYSFLHEMERAKAAMDFVG